MSHGVALGYVCLTVEYIYALQIGKYTDVYAIQIVLQNTPITTATKSDAKEQPPSSPHPSGRKSCVDLGAAFIVFHGVEGGRKQRERHQCERRRVCVFAVWSSSNGQFFPKQAYGK